MTNGQDDASPPDDVPVGDPVHHESHWSSVGMLVGIRPVLSLACWLAPWAIRASRTGWRLRCVGAERWPAVSKASALESRPA